MNVVVVGSLPPPEGEQSRRLLAEVLAYRARGDDVTIVAPSVYAVAHHRLDTTLPGWPFRLIRLLRGSGEVVLQIEPGFPLPLGAGRVRRTVSLAELVICLKVVRAPVTVRVPTVHALPLGLGGRVACALWASATRLVGGDDETVATLSGLVDGASAKVFLAEPAPPSPRPPIEGVEGGEADLESATALVRARAASERAALARRATPPGATPVRVPLWEWVPEPGAGVPRFGGLPEVHRPPAATAQVSVARALLYAVERRPATRPLARGARRARALVIRR